MKEGTVKFSNGKGKEKVPFVIYADFEALITPWKEYKGGTKQYQKHVACGFCFQTVCEFDENIRFEPFFYRAENEEEEVAGIFVEMIARMRSEGLTEPGELPRR